MRYLLALLIIVMACSYYVYLITGAWLYGHKLLRYNKSSLANLLWYWTKWPALGYIILVPVAAVFVDVFGIDDVVNTVLCLIAWWFCRNSGDDDDHKKLKDKLKSKVTQMQGRLVVVPA